MLELTYIYSLMCHAIVMCSVLMAHHGRVLAQSSAEVARRALPGQARPAGENGARAHFELIVLTQRLTLTDDQQSQVRRALAEREQQMEELRQAMQNDPNAVGTERDKLRALRQETDVRVAALLSEQQKARFAAWVDERNAARGHLRQRHREEPPPARDELRESLALM